MSSGTFTRFRLLFSGFLVLALSIQIGVCSETPLARIAVVSNPYITVLPPDEIKDENGSVRSFLATTGPESMEKTVNLVNKLRPDAFVVLGSLSWAGSPEEFQTVAGYLKQVTVPVLVTPGHRDRLSGAMEDFHRIFAEYRVENSVHTLNGISLAFAGDLDKEPDKATTRLKEQLHQVGSDKGVLLFSGLDRSVPRSKLTADHASFWRLVEEEKIALRLDPTRYGHQIGYTNTLPEWKVPSSAWSARGAVTMMNVYADRVEIGQVSDITTPSFSLTLPNPVAAKRMDSAQDDPFNSPSYSLDLASKPEFTFALVSDPQFDREANRDYLIQKAKAAIDDLNRLNPAMVFVAGDLVNNNLPEEWQLFNQIFNQLKPPRYVVPGNHDVLFNYDFEEKSYSAAPEQKPEYDRIVQDAVAQAKSDGFQGSTALYEKYTGSKPRQLVEHKDCAFITVPFLTTRADEEQVAYLREQLRKTAAKRHVFVVAHYPVLPAFGNNVQPNLGGTEVLSMLSEHRVTGFLFGHRHRNGFQTHQRTAHVLSDNMLTIHLFHVFDDRIVIGRKRVNAPLYEKLTVYSSR